MEDNITLQSTGDLQNNSIYFHTEPGKPPVLALMSDGDILVNGKLVENDEEVVEGLRNFLRYHNR